MSVQLKYRVRAYKRFLVQRIRMLKGSAFKVKLLRPLAKDFKAYLADYFPGVHVSNPARDIRDLIGYGDKFDAEFAFLYFGQLCPQFIEDYSDTYIARLIQKCFSPDDVNDHLRRINSKGKAIYEEL